MDYGRFVRKLELPPGFRAPTVLTYEDISARPRSPVPGAMQAPPTPSSLTSTASRPVSFVTLTEAGVADACLATLVSASETTK
jgi:hypothetical protein